MLRSSWSAFDMKDSTNDKNSIGAPRIRMPDSGVKKLGRNDIN
jgi:hypothetical protein